MDSKEFIEGVIVKAPHEKAPDFVKAGVSIKTQDLIAYLQKKGKDWVNFQIKEGRSGKWYAELDTWEPAGGRGEPVAQTPSKEMDDDIPF